MVRDEILGHIITIVISILTAVTTTFLVNHMKNKKRKVVEQIAPYDHRINIINCIAIHSLLSFILALIVAGVKLDQNYKMVFIILNNMAIMLFIFANLRFHKSFLIHTLKNKETKWNLILISIFILVIWVSILVAMFFIRSFRDKPTSITYLFILFFYTTLFNLKQYFKQDIIRNYRKIIVVTIDGIRYETTELINLDDYIVIYETKRDTRVMIPNQQIKVIEYEYQKITIAEFIDKEH